MGLKSPIYQNYTEDSAELAGTLWRVFCVYKSTVLMSDLYGGRVA